MLVYFVYTLEGSRKIRFLWKGQEKYVFKVCVLPKILPRVPRRERSRGRTRERSRERSRQSAAQEQFFKSSKNPILATQYLRKYRTIAKYLKKLKNA